MVLDTGVLLIRFPKVYKQACYPRGNGLRVWVKAEGIWMSTGSSAVMCRVYGYICSVVYQPPSMLRGVCYMVVEVRCEGPREYQVVPQQSKSFPPKRFMLRIIISVHI